MRNDCGLPSHWDLVLLTLQELGYELSDICGCTSILLHTTRGLVTLGPRRRHVLEIAGLIIHVVGSERNSLGKSRGLPGARWKETVISCI